MEEKKLQVKTTNKCFTIRKDINNNLLVFKFYNGDQHKEISISPELIGSSAIPLTEIFD